MVEDTPFLPQNAAQCRKGVGIADSLSSEKPCHSIITLHRGTISKTSALENFLKA